MKNTWSNSGHHQRTAYLGTTDELSSAHPLHRKWWWYFGENGWKNAVNNERRFLFPVKAMSIVYRGKFLQALQQMITKGEVILPVDTDSKQLFNCIV